MVIGQKSWIEQTKIKTEYRYSNIKFRIKIQITFKISKTKILPEILFDYLRNKHNYILLVIPLPIIKTTFFPFFLSILIQVFQKQVRCKKHHRNKCNNLN